MCKACYQPRHAPLTRHTTTASLPHVLQHRLPAPHSVTTIAVIITYTQGLPGTAGFHGATAIHPKELARLHQPARHVERCAYLFKHPPLTDGNELLYLSGLRPTCECEPHHYVSGHNPAWALRWSPTPPCKGVLAPITTNRRDWLAE